MRDSVDHDKRWVTAAFTGMGFAPSDWMKLRLLRFPDEFKQGMAARAETLGDAGAHGTRALGRWTCEPFLAPAIVIFARDDAGTRRGVSEHEKLIASCPGVEVSCSQPPPFPAIWLRARAFRLSRQAVRAGNRGKRVLTPGNRLSLETRRIHPWLSRRARCRSRQPPPKILARNGHGLSAARRACSEVPRFSPAAR